MLFIIWFHLFNICEVLFMFFHVTTFFPLSHCPLVDSYALAMHFGTHLSIELALWNCIGYVCSVPNFNLSNYYINVSQFGEQTVSIKAKEISMFTGNTTIVPLNITKRDSWVQCQEISPEHYLVWLRSSITKLLISST